jgi:hypothetical protein
LKKVENSSVTKSGQNGDDGLGGEGAAAAADNEVGVEFMSIEGAIAASKKK